MNDVIMTSSSAQNGNSGTQLATKVKFNLETFVKLETRINFETSLLSW